MNHTGQPWCRHPRQECTCDLYERRWGIEDPLAGFEILRTVSTAALQIDLDDHLHRGGHPVDLASLDQSTFEQVLTEHVFPALERRQGTRLHLDHHVVRVDAATPTEATPGLAWE